MQSHCQHNLYICHCTPSSQDPSPIHPLSTSTSSNNGGHFQTTTLHRFPAKNRNPAAGNGNLVHTETGNGTLKARPVYVSHSSVAVMTSPTLHITSNNTNASSSAVSSSKKARENSNNMDIFGGGGSLTAASTKKAAQSVDLLNMQDTSLSPSTASSSSSLHGGLTGNGNTTGMPAPQTPLSYNHQTQFVTLPVNTATSSVRHKYFQCCGTPVHGRSCLERMIFCLMVILMVAVFLVAALLCLHIGSGGLKRLSSYMFADQVSSSAAASNYDHANGLILDSSSYGNQQPLQPELADLLNDGIDIVRIKTTEEVSNTQLKSVD